MASGPCIFLSMIGSYKGGQRLDLSKGLLFSVLRKAL